MQASTEKKNFVENGIKSGSNSSSSISRIKNTLHSILASASSERANRVIIKMLKNVDTCENGKLVWGH